MSTEKTPRSVGVAAWRAYERAHASRGLSAATLGHRRLVFRRFLRHAKTTAKRARRKDVLAFLAARQEAGLASTTLRAEQSALRSVFAILVEVGYCQVNPAAELSVKAPTHVKPPLILSQQAVRDLLRATVEVTYSPQRRALSLRDRALVELLYALGLRASEVCAARVVDLSLKDGSLHVRRAKGAKNAVLPLPPACLPHLSAYLREGRPVLDKLGCDRLLLTWTGKEVRPGDLGVILKRIADRVGVRAHPHAFRRTLASHLAEAGVSLESIRLLLGHVQLENTARYVGVSREALRKCVGYVDWERRTSA